MQASRIPANLPGLAGTCNRKPAGVGVGLPICFLDRSEVEEVPRMLGRRPAPWGRLGTVGGRGAAPPRAAALWEAAELQGKDR